MLEAFFQVDFFKFIIAWQLEGVEKNQTGSKAGVFGKVNNAEEAHLRKKHNAKPSVEDIPHIFMGSFLFFLMGFCGEKIGIEVVCSYVEPVESSGEGSFQEIVKCWLGLYFFPGRWEEGFWLVKVSAVWQRVRFRLTMQFCCQL